MKRIVSLLLALVLVTSLCACGAQTPVQSLPPEPILQTEAPTEAPAAPAEVTVTDMIGREVTVVPGSYSKVVCTSECAYKKRHKHWCKCFYFFHQRT